MGATVRSSVDDKVGTLALDNVARRNALGAGTVQEMLDAPSRFEAGDVRAVVVRTAEPTALWSAGHDIDELPVRGVDPLPFADPLEECTAQLARAVRSRSGDAIGAYKLQATTFVRAVALSAQDSQWINQLRHDVYAGDNHAEGIAAFWEKRPPEFS